MPGSRLPRTSSFLFATRARRAAWTVLLIGGIGLWLASGNRPQAPILRLDEQSAIILPDSFDVKGAHVSPHGTVLLWAINRPYLIVQNEARQQIVRSDSLFQPVAAILLEGDTLVEAVDAERQAIVRVDFQGRVKRHQSLQLPWIVESAIYSRGVWILGGRDLAGNYRVVAMNPSGARTRLHTVAANRHRGTELSMSLSESGGDVFAALLTRPYLATRIPALPPSAERTPPLVFPAPTLPKRNSGEKALWVALAVHALDDGFVRTFSDLRSDRRVLAIYDSEGRLVRTSLLDVPMAVLATVPDKRLMLAARRTDRLEIVTYQWRWTRDPLSKTEQ